jgi:hypothetical protein
VRCRFWCYFWKLKREPGVNPGRPRHCDRGGLANAKPLIPLFGIGKAASLMKRESGDLPEVG